MKVFSIRAEGIGIHLNKEEAGWLMVIFDRYSRGLGSLNRNDSSVFSFHEVFLKKVKEYCGSTKDIQL